MITSGNGGQEEEQFLTMYLRPMQQYVNAWILFALRTTAVTIVCRSGVYHAEVGFHLAHHIYVVPYLFQDTFFLLS